MWELLQVEREFAGRMALFFEQLGGTGRWA